MDMCDGPLNEDNVVGYEFIQILEKEEFPYAIPDFDTSLLSKMDMKLMAEKIGICTQKLYFAYDLENFAKKTEYIHFPMIVKQNNGKNSVGLTHNFVVTNIEELSR